MREQQPTTTFPTIDTGTTRLISGPEIGDVLTGEIDVFNMEGAHVEFGVPGVNFTWSVYGESAEDTKDDRHEGTLPPKNFQPGGQPLRDTLAHFEELDRQRGTAQHPNSLTINQIFIPLGGDHR